jgi:SpoVK/Ycf46/Vps4 family AAA+-type ATPase
MGIGSGGPTCGSPPEAAAPSEAPLSGPGNTPREPPHLHVVGDEEAEMVPRVRFADVGGMEEVKERLTRSFLTPLRNPDLVREYGQAIRGGLLLYGPPGCGKTFLARAVAGEIGARFVSVALNDVLDMWFGESEPKLHELFENARRQKPTIVFFDEADALGQRRSQLEGGAGRTLANQLFAEMDGFESSNEGLFLLAATNHPWDVDPALRRPGRFDRMVFVPPPDVHARRAILELKLRDRFVGRNVDLDAVASATEGFSGADLSGVVGTAAEMALESSVKRGTDVPIDDDLLRRAVREARPSTRPWFEVARNHALYANEGGVYDELLGHLKKMRLA